MGRDRDGEQRGDFCCCGWKHWALKGKLILNSSTYSPRMLLRLWGAPFVPSKISVGIKPKAKESRT